MSALKLLEAHKYTEAIEECQRSLSVKADDIGAVATLASALRAIERYEEAIPLFERVGLQERADKIASGRPGRQIDIACLYWILGNRQKAVQNVRELVEGILKGYIKFGDAAGGVEQGLLLYYMAVTDNRPQDIAFSLDYFKNRAKRPFIQSWPGPVANYFLGTITFTDLVEAASGQRGLREAIEVAKTKILSRRRLSVALFHDGVRSRALGDEERCLVRMRECYELENPLIEQEWYLARYEVQKANNRMMAR
jgi:tetratricopeptide (TPR) repeat protein